MKVAIIGVGKMGEWFAKFFIKEGIEVIVSDKDSNKLSRIAAELNLEATNNVDAVKKANRIFVCVPIENFEEAITEISPHIRHGQEVIDICSVKEEPVNILHKYIKRGITLGTHPLFGPGAESIQNQSFVLTPTNILEKKLAETFGKWLESKGARVIFMHPKEHDKLMSIVLGLPYFLSLTACDTLVSCGLFNEAKRVSSTSYKFVLTLVEALLSEKTEFLANLQLNLPKTDKIYSFFLEKTEEWVKLLKQGNKTALINRIDILKKDLEKLDPGYPQSYKLMYKMLEALKEQRNA